jgi:hypothetical protein
MIKTGDVITAVGGSEWGTVLEITGRLNAIAIVERADGKLIALPTCLFIEDRFGELRFRHVRDEVNYNAF